MAHFSTGRFFDCETRRDRSRGVPETMTSSRVANLACGRRGRRGPLVVPDWPGVGRSGYIPLDDLTGDVVVEGLGKIVASLGQPAIIMTHSMSGAYGWKLIEKYGQHIARLVAIAPGPPGNIQAVSDTVSETADTVVVRGSTTLTINLKQPVVSDRNFVEVKLVGKSTQFPREHIAVYASSLTPIPPRRLFQ